MSVDPMSDLIADDSLVPCTGETVSGRRCRNLVPADNGTYEPQMLDPLDTEQMRQQRCRVHLRAESEHVAEVVALDAYRQRRLFQ